MPRRRLRPLQYPSTLERKYLRRLNEIVRQMRDVSQEGVDQILSHPTWRKDATEQEIGSFKAILAAVKRRWGATLPDPLVEQIARDIWSEHNRAHVAAFNRAYKGVLPVQAIGAEWEGGQAAAWVAENVSLIKSISDQYFTEIEAIVVRALAEGSRVETVRTRIRERFGVSRRKAALLARDQIGKAQGRFDRARQEAAGIEQWEWSTSGDERVRRSHQQVNGKVYSWDKLPVVDGVETFPGQPIQCFPGSTRVGSLRGCEIAYRRWYSGETTQVVTETGTVLLCTPNHPILTPQGWVPAKSLDRGSQLVHASPKPRFGVDADEYERKPLMADVFCALSLISLVGETSGGMSSQFHGDGTDQDVDVVLVDSVLLNAGDAPICQSGRQQILAEAFMRLPASSRSSDFFAVLQTLGFPPNRLVRGAGQLLALLERCPPHAGVHGRTTIANLHSVLEEYAPDWGARDVKLFTECFFADPSLVGVHNLLLGQLFTRDVLGAIDAGVQPPSAQVLAQGVGVHTGALSGLLQGGSAGYTLDRVLDVSVGNFTGHVYNFQSRQGWYEANGIVAHNCRCTPVPVLEF